MGSRAISFYNALYDNRPALPWQFHREQIFCQDWSFTLFADLSGWLLIGVTIVACGFCLLILVWHRLTPLVRALYS